MQADYQFFPNFYSLLESEKYFTQLYHELNWEEKEIFIFGKKVMQPRLVAWYGDEGIGYTYSGLRQEARGWHPTLVEIKEKIEAHCHLKFNSVLCNLYRNGKDSMGKHCDDEPELGKNPIIASLSLGETRNFRFLPRYDKSLKPISLHLTAGSLLVMQGETQHFWQHELPKSARVLAPRINLTFRKILT